jgi:hypothetical protein
MHGLVLILLLEKKEYLKNLKCMNLDLDIVNLLIIAEEAIITKSEEYSKLSEREQEICLAGFKAGAKWAFRHSISTLNQNISSKND